MSEAAGVWWDGIPCAPEGTRYYRARGLEPSTSTVVVPRSYFRDSLAPEEPRDLFALRPEQTPALLGQMHAPAPVTFLPIPRPPFAGDLVIAQGESEQPPRMLRARQLYLVEARILDPRHGADAMVQLVLADMRRFWEYYGHTVTREWNVGLPQTTSILIPGSGVVDREEQERRRYVAHTARERGTAPTPLRAIVQELLEYLPGRLQIVQWPDAYLEGKAPPEVRCWGASPKEVLAAILDAYRLEIDIGADLKARIYGFAEGDVGEAEADGHGGDLVRLHDPETGHGVWASAITADGNRYARRPSHRPREVEVIGDKTVTEVTVDYLTPVLVYEERPEGKAPRTAVLEVSPDNLRALARGTLFDDPDNPPAEGALVSDRADRARINMILGARDKGAVPVNLLVPAAPEPVKEDALQGVFWQQFIFEDDDAWSRGFPHLPEPVRELLRRQLWRYYMVPEHLRRLLPLLARAERDFKGDRLKPKVEAFTFRRTSASVKKPDTEKEEREANLKKLDEVMKSIREFEGSKERLQAPSLSEVALAIRTTIERGGAARPGYARTRDEQAIDRAAEAHAQVGRSWLRALRDGARDLNIFGAESIADLAEWLGADDGLSSDQVDARIAVIDEEIRALREVEAQIMRELNPRGALERELGAVEAEIRRTTAATGGVVSSALRNRRDDLIAQINETVRKAAEEGQKPPDRSKTHEEVVFHLNLSRDEVEYRVVDADLGIIEVLGDLPGWLADPMVSDQRKTFFIPMPVRITFGTFNGLPTVLRTGAPLFVNFYVQRSIGMIASDPRLWPYLGRMGHRIPAAPGEEQIRFTFTQEDQESGEAEVGDHPWRILFDDPDNPLRLLVRLTGPEQLTAAPSATREALPSEVVPLDNRAELLARAIPFAKAALAAPAELDSGSLAVHGPRTVVLNGRVSAVAVTYQDNSWVTEVSFGADAAPLPGEEGPVRQRGPVRLVFGLDVEGNRDK